MNSFIRIAAPVLAALSMVSLCLSSSQADAQEAPQSSQALSITPEQIEERLIDPQTLVIQTEKDNLLFKVELALEEKERNKGLMFRTSLAPQHGMLFDFGATEPVFMWMKNTYISLDMFFINEAGTITHIVTATTPLSESVIGSGGPVRYVLETPKGTAKSLGIKIGDKMRHQLFTPNS
ncbi:DUF192 domain-containing protein [uncultured Cohaesibacter sp.]|uniref:DUF192 domain-containing protein n=1 Tax=uncultured Cohaesibacter sp. TaxID=1002546 RepID=UPI0029318A24|nr:DUF192 domain-containing protein [uncultured Cohaesibacter sp.]